MSYNDEQLGQVPTKYGESAKSPLTALVENRCVVLSVNDDRMRLKKRVQNPVLMIAPTSLYGSNDGNFLFSMPGYGSEIIDIKDISPLQLYRIGMTMNSSKILVKEINALFNEQ